MPANLLLELPDVDIDTVARTSTGIEIVARSRTQTGVCPDCQHPSHSLHSRYGREPQDLPCFGEPVRLKLTVSRFRCRNPECRRQTFVERLPNLVSFYARCTRRLVTVLQLTTIESGAETGARIVKAFGINVGGDTLLRLLRRIVLPEIGNVQKIGIDDWAFKKGLRYGTLLIDLERRHPIDVLPDRQGETVKNWLTQHPGIELVTRDRSRDYARAISAGAPQALQVADRWHLLKNLTEALQKALDKYAKQLGRWTVDEQSPSPVPAVDHAPRLSAAKHAAKQLRHTARQERFEQVHHLNRLGWQQRQIAHHLGLCSRTVRRYLAQDTLLPTHRCHTSKLDPHKGYLLRRWNEGCHNARRLLDELRLQGYSGGKTIVRDYLATLRHTQKTGLHDGKNLVIPRALTARRAAFLLLQPPGKPDDSGSMAFLQQLLIRLPEVRSVVEPFQTFAALVRERRAQELDPWMQMALHSPCNALRQFARGLQQDEAAVRAALTVEWSNGQAEDQVSRLKLLKRQMYGRAKFDLLRLRVLYSARLHEMRG